MVGSRKASSRIFTAPARLHHRFLSAVYADSTGVWSTMSRQYKLLLA